MIQKYKGVNLGGWLLLEKWITPSLFKGLNANDEYSFHLELKQESQRIIKAHWDSFISEEDFKWIYQHGLNAVRIPVGHWIFGNTPPYIKNIQYLDWAFDQAKKYSIQILIDLHAAPGSQNGWDHSGITGKFEWHKSEQNINNTLKVIEELAQRYCSTNNLVGISLLNEPKWNVPHKTLVNFYKEGYKTVRDKCTENVAVVISDAFRPNDWKNIMTEPEYENVWLDMHLYQCFDIKDKLLDIKGHIKKTEENWTIQLQQDKPVIVGEWSLALDPLSLRNLNNEQKEIAVKEYAKAQLQTFENAKGWFFWNYKTEGHGGWDFRYCVEEDYIPEKF